MTDEIWKYKGSGESEKYGKVSEGIRGHQIDVRNMIEALHPEYEDENAPMPPA